ncbi:hypothetical protein LTR37_002260 [Vermiconidia calcicola]|uniref:Uncharacterized protein n=1 Tax=Vermiconidia calcicola TaxID=1690605 RepID=A0ACC3NUZ4_9PEZI|nr:hypothetical protein LTR37_002260 [Vermiconidia calcicola]
MAYSGGHRAPNVSQYLANLNSVPSAHEIPNNDIALGDAELDFLTNAEFFDFDSFNPNAVENFNRHDGENKGAHPSVNGTGFQFGEFQTYPSTVTSSPGANGIHGQYPPPAGAQFGTPQIGEKRKASVTNTIPSPADLEDQSRFAAEEDKRRRNTAASARFRIKKKQREAALEKAAKEMTDKVSSLESKVQQLEMENKWLKGLITDKSEGKGIESIPKEKESEDRKQDDKTDGVGTADDAEGEDDDEVKSDI